MVSRFSVLVASASALALAHSHRAAAESPFATEVVSYVPGVGTVFGYTNPAVALGSPERLTGEPFTPQVVTPFQPAYLPGEIVSIGMGGALVLTFDHDVLDDANNPFGVDLLVFGNAFLTDVAAPRGVVGGMFAEGGTISVSPDGLTWTPVPDVAADGPLPTLGYSDVGPYATTIGRLPTDFTRPVNPALTARSLIGADWATLLDAYEGSGGGAGIDLGALGLARVRFVRIEGNAVFGSSPEIDAISDVAPQAPSADLDGDGSVSAADLAILLGAWGEGGAADLDGDGIVGGSDLALLLGSWS